MSWISDYTYTWLEKCAINVMRYGGRVPRHIAIVMDGNRRYARSEKLKKIEGHSRGFDKLANCVRWCLDLGIQEVTTFAFSIENYKRSSEEVNDLFNLAREKFTKILLEKEKLDAHGVCIRIIGNIDLLPHDIQILIANIMLCTAHNNKLHLNIAFSYTSRDEITQAIEMVLKYGDELKSHNITEKLIEQCLYLNSSPPPDLIFRTSGETRLSDFMMWQLSGSVLYFTKILWPQITIWKFLSGIFVYQRARLKIDHKMTKRISKEPLCNSIKCKDTIVQRFLNRVQLQRDELLLKLSTS